MEAASGVHFWFNVVEAVVWLFSGAVVAVAAHRSSPEYRRVGHVAAIAFAVFAVTDIVELRTGAWFRPTWLLLLNVGCVTTLVACLVAFVRKRRTLPGSRSTSSSEPE